MLDICKSQGWLAIVALAALPFTSTLQAVPAESAASTSTLFSDPVIATAKGFEIKRSQLDEAFTDYNATVASRGNTIPDTERPAIRSNLLQHLIIDHILLGMASATERADVEGRVDKSIAEARSNAPTPAAFEEQIKASGKTLPQMRQRAIDDLICRHMLLHETTNGIVVADAEVKKFYDDNPDKFKMPERVRAAHILIATSDPVTKQPLSPDKKKEKLQQAKDLKVRAEKGEDFASLVKEYSDDPGSKRNGGEYTFKRGDMVPEFEAAAFSMKINQISDPVETQYGYHIIKLLEKLPASTEDYAKAEPDIRDYLLTQQAQKVLPGYLDKLRAANDVKVIGESGAVAPAGK